MRKLVVLIFTLCLIFAISHPLSLAVAQDSNPGPAGVALVEYVFSRIVCTSVPIGYIALLVILVIAGFKYLVSAGEAKAVTSAHQTVTWGILGILFLAIAWLVLLLIQSFTGVKVTQFSLSSLPGVQGFTGSCWGPAPVAPNPTPASSQISPTLSQPNTRPQQTELKICHDSNQWFSQAPDNLSGITYTNADDILELENVLASRITIRILVGSMDNKIYRLKPEAAEMLYNFSTSHPVDDPIYYLIKSTNITILAANGNWVGAWEKVEKGKDLTEFEKAVANAQEVAKKVDPSFDHHDGRGGYYLPPPDKHSYIICDDADFYYIQLVSPLIYIYPQKPTAVSLKINSPIVSTQIPLTNNTWNLVAQPNGTLVTITGNKYPNIAYEFFRHDFKKPVNGFVITSDKLEKFLKNNFWPKLGLKDQEITDYWIDAKPRIPKADYYFISLIDRSEIDRVLPMKINPKPDTIIRNMTYIRPLSTPFTPQPLPEELTAPQRDRFTVVENGVFIDGL